MFYDLLRHIPFEIHIVAGVVLFAGVVIWAFGHRLLRPMLVLAGMVVGAAVGFVATGFVSEAAPAWVVVLVVAGVFSLLAVAAYRFVMSALLAGSLAIALPLGFYAYTEFSGQYAGQSGEPISAEELYLPLGEEGVIPDVGDDLTEQLVKDELQKRWDRLRSILKGENVEDIEGEDSLGDERTVAGETDEDLAESSWRTHWRTTIDLIASTARLRWQDAPAGQKWGMVFCGIIGAIAGFLSGMLVPSASAAIVTSVTGAAFIMTGVLWLGTRIGIPESLLQPSSATTVLIIWMLLAVTGIIIQLVLRSRAKADKT